MAGFYDSENHGMDTSEVMTWVIFLQENLSYENITFEDLKIKLILATSVLSIISQIKDKINIRRSQFSFNCAAL